MLPHGEPNEEGKWYYSAHNSRPEVQSDLDDVIRIVITLRMSSFLPGLIRRGGGGGGPLGRGLTVCLTSIVDNASVQTLQNQDI
jgi:hypothetical protein